MENLYIHFPYCETKCHYCDFFSLPERKYPEMARLKIYEAIVKELGFYKGHLAPLSTVFLGGGTPSLVPLNFMEQLMKSLEVIPQAEITIEANPSSITEENTQAWRAMGINRVSMGMQALEDNRLVWLGRIHSVSEIFLALEKIFDAGFERVSVDYILGVPGQTKEKIREEVSYLLARFPWIEHVSAYLLTLNSSNPKYQELLPESEQLEHLRVARDVLAEHGFLQYEISNFAKPNGKARHNENYWLGGGYLGIGPSAHSFWPEENSRRARRVKNWASVHKYSELVAQGVRPVEWAEELTLEQERLEFLMLRLRRSEGLHLGEYKKRFGQDLLKDKAVWLNQFLAKGLCKVEAETSNMPALAKEQDQVLQLQGDGFFLSDQILSLLSA